MKRVLLQFADESFLVRPELADRVKLVIPSHRYDSTTIDYADPPIPSRLTGAQPRQSVFERNQPNNLNPRQQSLAERLAKRLTK